MSLVRFPFSNSVTTPVDITFTANAEDTGGGTSYTFSSQSIGTADATRIVVVQANSVAIAGNINSITVGGISATQAVNINGEDNQRLGIWYASVPTGTTADVVVTWSTSMARCGIGVWAMYNADATPHDTDTDFHNFSSSSPTTLSLNVPANGAVISAAQGSASTLYTYTWSGLTEDFDTSVETSTSHTGAHDEFTTEQVGLSVTCTPSGGNRQVHVGVSWGPLS